MDIFEATSAEYISSHNPIPLGYEDETGVVGVSFDISKLGWDTKYGLDGVAELRFWRPSEGDGYIIPLTKVSDTIWEWRPDETDLSNNGSGYFQLFYKKEELVKASHWWNVYIKRSIEIGRPSGERFQRWYDEIKEIAESAHENIGNVDELLTKAKDSLTSAVNEVVIDIAKPKITKIKPCAYEAWYNDLDYANAYEYYKSTGDIPNLGACSAIRNGEFFGRQFDWKYDRNAEFVVHVPKIAKWHASIGVAGGLADLTDDFVSSGEYSPYYKILPFNLRDGINDAGVIAEMNVVPREKGNNDYVTPLLDQKAEIPAIMMCRYILDNFGSATEAVEFVRDHAAVYFSKALHDMDYELHYLIADSDSTYVMEFVDGHTSIVEANYITNFHITGVQFNQNGSVYTPETQDSDHDAIRTNLITPHGSGLERWNYICENYDSCDSAEGMRALLDGLTYTKAYSTSESPSDPYWYTEFVGDNTVATPVSGYSEIVAAAGEAFLNRSRDDVDPFTWQTVHSIIYDISEKTASIIFQEDGEEIAFKLGGGEGVTDHRKLTHRNDPDQHDISAIAGLQDALNGKQSKIAASGILKGDGEGNVTAAEEGVDYQGPISKSTEISDESTDDEIPTAKAVYTATENKLSEPSSGLAVGKYFRVASIDENGHAVLEAVDAPSAAMKIKMNWGPSGEKILNTDEDGYVVLPIADTTPILPSASTEKYGIIALASGGGLTKHVYGTTGIRNPDDSDITNRQWTYIFSKAITCRQLDFAVKTAMTDGVGAAWTDAEKQSALTRLGITVDENGFCKFGE